MDEDMLTNQNKYQAVIFLYHLLDFLKKFRNLIKTIWTKIEFQKTMISLHLIGSSVKQLKSKCTYQFTTFREPFTE